MTTRTWNGAGLIGAVIIVILMLAAGYYLVAPLQTAPSNPPDRNGSAESNPAGPADPRVQATTRSVDPNSP
jgi:hypothetical protein